MIKLTGLEREQHKKIGALSKGYRQRVGLAQALIHDPSVLVLDEPTTGLDPNQIVEIRGLISEAGKSKTILLSTHIMQEVEAICHKIVIINKGEIVADEMAKDIYLRAASKEFSVMVELNSVMEEKMFENIPNVQKVLKIRDKNWVLSNVDGIDFREDVFNFAVRNNVKVLSMQRLERSLEEVFRELTR
jgi:ABC-2 type transport system ATP-binding protein